MEDSCILINGGKRLWGEIKVQGSKNTILPVMAASLLSKGTTVLYHPPRIQDVFFMASIMEEIGCRIAWENDAMIIDTARELDSSIREGKVSCFRGSSLFMGALLGRCGHVSIEKPGGCQIGKRPLDFHLNGFSALGASVVEEKNRYILRGDRLKGTSIRFPFPSVGATENLMIAAAAAEGVTCLFGCACEPEIRDLAAFLRALGVRVEGAGTPMIKVYGTRGIHSSNYQVPYDRIAAATFLLGAVITEGDVCINSLDDTYRLNNTILLLDQMGATVKKGKNQVYVKMRGLPKSLKIKTGPHPETPTDIQSMLTAVALKASGPSVIQENIFESRFQVCSELVKLGGKIRINGNKAFVTPVQKLTGTTVFAEDLRGGAALCLAALAAEGQTCIKSCSYIKRGYEDIVRDFALLGAQIQEVIG